MASAIESVIESAVVLVWLTGIARGSPAVSCVAITYAQLVLPDICAGEITRAEDMDKQHSPRKARFMDGKLGTERLGDLLIQKKPGSWHQASQPAECSLASMR